MNTNLTSKTIEYFNKEALSKLGTRTGDSFVELAAEYVTEALNEHIEITANENGRKSATRNGEKITVRDAKKLLDQLGSMRIRLQDGEIYNCPEDRQEELAAAINQTTDEQVKAKEEELRNDPLVGKTVRATQMIYTHRESYGGARRGTIIKIERREIHGYIGRTLKKNREVMIQESYFDAIQVIDPETQYRQPEPIQAAEINPEIQNEQLSISEGFFNAQTERKPQTTRTVYVLVKCFEGEDRKRIVDRAYRPEDLDASGFRNTSVETRQVVWCEEFENNPEDWEQTRAYDLYTRSNEKGYSAVNVGEAWRSNDPEPWLEDIAQLRAQGLPLIYMERSTAWATDLQILQKGGYRLGNIIEVEDLGYSFGMMDKAIEILY